MAKQIKASDFGEDFKWGVAMSAAQNEGAVLEDGRSQSIWDVFAKRQTAIEGRAKPTHSSNFYHRYKDDLLLAKALGFNHFRFSISWSRILPEGIGKPNKKGIAFYHAVIDECLKIGLEPVVTLYHWDLPQALEKNGGWTSHQMLKWFSKFVNLCANEFGQKVKQWIVMNEPFGFTSLGYMLGKHAPGKMGLSNFFPAIHNAAMCTAEGGRIIRSEVPNAHIGTSFSCSEVMSHTLQDKDVLAAAKSDALLNRLLLEPVLGLGYPHMENFQFLEKLHLHTKSWRYQQQMAFDFDFIGIQNYFAVTVKNNNLIPYLQASEVTAKSRKVPHTQLGWEINPESFNRMLHRIWDYGNIPEIIVTEGGACFKDVFQHGVINDQQRIDYFKQYLGAVLKAKNSGVNIGGYYAWTLTDNFEWAFGYNARFGLIHVDFATQLRTIKQSGYWFRDFLQT